MGMRVLVLYNDKGGVSKTTSSPNLAAAIANLFPGTRVGLADFCSDHGHLSKRYAPEKEFQLQGLWALADAILDPRKKREPALASAAIREAVTLLRVVPGTTGEGGCVSFINVGVELSKNLRGASVFASVDSARKFGEAFLQHIEDTLALDYLVVDLPGMVEDAMVRSVLPHCYAAVIPVDMRCYMNLAEGGTLIGKLKDLEVFPSGFLRTFIEEGDKVPVAQENSEFALQKLSEDNQVPILKGGIPNKTTLVQAIEPVSQADGIPEVGLYCMAAQKGINSNQKALYGRSIQAFETALRAMIELPVDPTLPEEESNHA